ncbi:putative Ulp1 protease [Ordospora pajunii]|jgi:sentrin-specific protease 1|uniref:putative Ulp1 protease n=1 Tax=Ordospora pajunii TaxID=3039483 RepID=UPI002952712D|nr:putative Ulp1 protease [Ordospora pajunii]KAH9412280.1 putative Ulp1 protease [Ordospora pajunii]
MSQYNQADEGGKQTACMRCKKDCMLEVHTHDVSDCLAASATNEFEAAFRVCIHDELPISRMGYELLPQDLNRLADGGLLNDKIINVYFEIVSKYSTQAVHSFSTFFYSALRSRGVEWVQRWTSEVNIFDNKLIFIPVHVPGHWCLVVMDVEEMQLEYYDSLGTADMQVVDFVIEYLRAEWCRVCGDGFKISIKPMKDIPQQQNGTDCGVFVCMYARYRLEKNSKWFRSNEIKSLRKAILHEIMAGRIIYLVPHVLG